MPGCTTGFTLQEVIALLVTVVGLIGVPVGIQFRAAQAHNQEMLDLLKDQNNIQREQNEIQRETQEVLRSNGTRIAPRSPAPMSFWRLLFAGLYRTPKNHMPWLQHIAEQQREIRSDIEATHQAVEDLSRHLGMDPHLRTATRRQDINRRVPDGS